MADGSRPPVLVTGATGFTGGHLALALKRRGQRVRALVRPEAAVAQLQAAGVELIQGDLRSAADVARAAAGVECIYHIAALFRTAGHPDQVYHDINVTGTNHVLDAARRHKVGRVVHCSTIGVHGDVKEIPCHEESSFNPGDIYQRTKLEAELTAQRAFEQGLPGAIVRPAGIYGPGDLRFLKLFKAIYRGRFRMFGSGETLWHPVYIDDLVQGLILAGEHPDALGRLYIIADAQWTTLNDWVRGIAEAVGVTPPRNHLPFWPLQVSATVCEAVCRPFGLEPPLHHRRIGFFSKNRAFSIDRAQRELGYAPQVAIQDGLRRTAAWYFEQGLLPRRAA